MYEIWLVMNIVWEIALDAWPWLLAAAALWVLLVALAARGGPGPLTLGLGPAVGVGVVVALVAAVAVPGMVKSSISELAYWVDWANLAAISLGAGAAAVAFAWPLSRLRALRRPVRTA